MFDLFRRRDTAMRYVLIALLGLVAISMVVTLIPGFGTGGGSRSDQLIAEIDGAPVTIREVSLRIEQQLRNSGMNRANGLVVANNTVEQVVAQRAAEYVARRMGFTVSDQELIEAVKLILPQAFPGGQFVGKDGYAALLAQRGISVGEFESRLRQQLLVQKLGSMIDESLVITPDEIEAEFHRQNDKIKIEYVTLRGSEIAKQISVTEAELRAQYDKNAAAYRQPERRRATVLFVDEQKMAQSVQPTEADLRRAYDEQRDRFRLPERLKVRHILLTTTGKPASEAPSIQAKAEDLLRKIRAGANFAELAKTYSEDPGSARNGGDLGFIERGQMVKNFEEAAFALKPGEISNVIKTEYGFHILQLMEKQEARVRPFEEARAELAAEAQRQLVYDRMQQAIENLRTVLRKRPANLEALAAQHGAELIQSGPLQPGDSVIAGLGAVPELIAQLFSLREGEVTGIVQAGSSRLALAVVTGVEAERPATFEEAAPQIRQQLLARRASELRTEWAKKIAEEARAPGSDLRAIAAKYKLPYKATPEFGINGAAEGLGSAELLRDAFGKPKGYVPAPVGGGEDLFVVRVLETLPADVAQLAAQRDTILQQLKQSRGRERGELFQESLVQQLTQAGKIKMYPDNVKRLLASYGATT